MMMRARWGWQLAWMAARSSCPAAAREGAPWEERNSADAGGARRRRRRSRRGTTCA